MTRFRLTEPIRLRLKRPLGDLLSQSSELNVETLRKRIQEKKPTRIISVGDVVSRACAKAELWTDVKVIDNMEMRQRMQPFTFNGIAITIHVTNPAGAIEQSAWDAVSNAIKNGEALVVVDGEEDLLTLPAVLEAPLGSLVLYGQPKTGMVVIEVDEEKKTEVKMIVDAMTRENS